MNKFNFNDTVHLQFNHNSNQVISLQLNLLKINESIVDQDNESIQGEPEVCIFFN